MLTSGLATFRMKKFAEEDDSKTRDLLDKFENGYLKINPKIEKEQSVPFLAGTLASIGGSLGGIAANKAAYKATLKNIKNDVLLTPEEEKELLRLSGHPDVKMYDVAHAIGADGPMFSQGNMSNLDYFLGKDIPEGGVIVRHPGSATTPHEIGHMAGPLGNAKLPRPVKALTRSMYSGGLLANRFGVSGLVATQRALEKERTGKDDDKLRAVDYVNRALTSAMLAEEAQATLHGGYLTNKLKGARGGLGAVRGGAPGFATYALMAAANHVAAPLATTYGYRLAKNWRDRVMAQKAGEGKEG